MDTERQTSPLPTGVVQRLAVVLFIVVLLAFVIQSQLTQYVQTTLGYRQPFFLFYVVHSSLIVMLPLHLLYLVLVTQCSLRYFIATIRRALIHHLPAAKSELHDSPFPTRRLVQLIFLLTSGITIPALLWYIAVSLASISDVTALWNTNAFFAYVFAVKLLHLRWQPTKLIAVTAATVGAAVVVYGGSTSTSDTSDPVLEDAARISAFIKPTAPLLGDVLTLVASIAYALYQVMYKKYVALPLDPESDPVEECDRLPASENDDAAAAEDMLLPSSETSVSPLPFGLYASFFTSAIGLCTLALLWIPIPILHYLGLEHFRLPRDILTVGVIACIAMSGVLFNGSLMILLGIWGPIITSVGNLLTIVLVFISDAVWGGAMQTVTIWSIIGASIIVGAFGVLVYDMGKTGRD
ncbi:hypothetical protein NEOLEDRAFT_1053416 [Neolentinus lepideus HHB14362 ss-1]|uniref:EamA domain-containing protein n=1 Tax=Neolentinus lepideus HHB14362 ss-1 TaxID=1314782 RepID=A0A165W277_9AGAM|nr:hypothetical protein NEOLEDRAFT_1053416 [Neolentinus lepideus HHB14362 ss-1]